MKSLLKALTLCILSLIMASEASMLFTSFSPSQLAHYDDIETIDPGEQESETKEKNENGKEPSEKFFVGSYDDKALMEKKLVVSYFVSRHSFKSNTVFEVISPPPQFFFSTIF